MSENIQQGTRVRVVGGGKWARMGEWIVVKVNPSTYKLKLSTDDTVILNASHGMVEVVGDGEPFSAWKAPERPVGLRTGALVKTKRPMKDFSMDQLFVVIKDKVDKVDIVQLGGNDRKMYWTVMPHMLEVITLPGTPS